jgi:hypothetical protein
MRIPLVPDQRDSRWKLLGKILNIFDLRKTKKIVARYTVPVKKTVNSLKIVVTSMFFSTTITHVLEELKREDLRNFMRIGKEEVPTKNYIYSLLSKFELNQFIDMILRILNSITKKRQRNTRIIVDCTDLTLDINFFRNPVRQRDLEGKDYKWGYSPKGMFIGMKLTLVLEYPSLRPLLFLLHPANRHESRIYPELMDELKRRRILKRGDVIIFDRGFYAYKNYLIGIGYRIIPLIFPRDSFNLNRLDGLMSYPLSLFDSKNLKREKEVFRKLKVKLMNLLSKWKNFKPVRSLIEDIFKLCKSMGLRNLHRYTMRSVYKYTVVNVFLIGVVVAVGVKEKKLLQRLAEM